MHSLKEELRGLRGLGIQPLYRLPYRKALYLCLAYAPPNLLDTA